MAMVLDRAWTGLRGAARYIHAILGGDIAPGAASIARINEGCRGCPHTQFHLGEFTGHITAWCGAPLVERVGEEIPPSDRTCGCIVGFVPESGRREVKAASVGERRSVALAQLAPAGKTLVGSEACPGGRWGPVERSGCCGGTGGCGGVGEGSAGGA